MYSILFIFQDSSCLHSRVKNHTSLFICILETMWFCSTHDEGRLCTMSKTLIVVMAMLKFFLSKRTLWGMDGWCSGQHTTWDTISHRPQRWVCALALLCALGFLLMHTGVPFSPSLWSQINLKMFRNNTSCNNHRVPMLMSTTHSCKYVPNSRKWKGTGVGTEKAFDPFEW